MIMWTIWQLNSITQHHITRFFQAATSVVEQWRDPDGVLLGSLLSLSGNMLWARSSFEAESEAESQAMAYTGAITGSLAGPAVAQLCGVAAWRQQALSVLAETERRLTACYDDLLTLLSGQLLAQGLGQATPAALNRAVWQRLFPAYPFQLSQAELRQAIRDQLIRQS